MSDIPGTPMMSESWMARNKEFQFPRNASSEEKLQLHWEKATVDWKWDATNQWFENILRFHSESSRHYHTLVHLEEMLGYLDLILQQQHVKTTTASYKSLVLTIFFHDAVYDPKSGSNEEDSARLFQEFMLDVKGNDEGSSNELESQVVSFILATKRHKSTHSESDEQLLLDVDMAVLGKERDAYMAYATLVRREYAFVDHDVFCEKRAQVLQGFLKCPAIFGTEIMRNALEERARANLQAELEMLQQGRIPGEEKGDD